MFVPSPRSNLLQEIEAEMARSEYTSTGLCAPLPLLISLNFSHSVVYYYHLFTIIISSKEQGDELSLGYTQGQACKVEK